MPNTAAAMAPKNKLWMTARFFLMKLRYHVKLLFTAQRERGRKKKLSITTEMKTTKKVQRFTYNTNAIKTFKQDTAKPMMNH